MELLSSAWAPHWQPAGIAEEGHVQVRGDELILASGQPMTGARFAAWMVPQFPLTRYAIAYEAMRAEGEDFFGTVTFPVGGLGTHVSFILGGWGGALVGISSIDHLDASENTTRSEQRFENGRWYRVRIEVRPDDLRAWIDGGIVINTSLKGRHLGLRGGDIERCRPFGFATYLATARIRRIVVERL